MAPGGFAGALARALQVSVSPDGSLNVTPGPVERIRCATHVDQSADDGR